MKTCRAALFVTILCQQLASAQEVFIVGKGGISSYGAVQGFAVGGGGGDQSWKLGPIIGLGARIRTSDAFAIEGLFEYSTHRYAVKYEWEIPPINDPRNRILEFTTMGRLSFRLVDIVHFVFLGGVSISYHHKDDIVPPNSQYITPGRRAVDVGGILGIGSEVRISKSIEISLEGSWRMRFYVTPVVQLGIAYGL